MQGLEWRAANLEWSVASIVAQESTIRLTVFLGVFLLLAISEVGMPRRHQRIRRLWRWPNNLIVMAIGTLLVRLLLPFSAVMLARWVEVHHWGLLNRVQLPSAVMTVGAVTAGAVIVLDFAIYLQHRIFHAAPWLWRLHRMHHADLEFDVTTGIRFHPLEILLSMGIKWGLIVVLGIPALSVLLFEILLNATSLFNHANLKLPKNLDRWLRWIIVTPDMHRVHHSWHLEETNSNFGFNLPWWDRLLGTYRPQPTEGHLLMTIGLNEFRDSKELRWDRMLLQPFQKALEGYPHGKSA